MTMNLVGQKIQEGRNVFLALSVAKKLLLCRENVASSSKTECEFKKEAQVAQSCFSILKRYKQQQGALENSEEDMDYIVGKIRTDSEGYKDLLKTLTKFENITENQQMETIMKESVKFFSDARIKSGGLDERKRSLVREMCLAVWVLLRGILKSNSAMSFTFSSFQGLNWINWFSQEYSEKNNQYLRSILADIRGTIQKEIGKDAKTPIKGHNSMRNMKLAIFADTGLGKMSKKTKTT